MTITKRMTAKGVWLGVQLSIYNQICCLMSLNPRDFLEEWVWTSWIVWLFVKWFRKGIFCCWYKRINSSVVFCSAGCTPVSITVCLKYGPGSLSNVKTRLQGWPGNGIHLRNGQAQFFWRNKRETGVCQPKDAICETPTVVWVARIYNMSVITLSLWPIMLFALLHHRCSGSWTGRAAFPADPNQGSPGSSTSLPGSHAGCQHPSATKGKSRETATKKFEGVSCRCQLSVVFSFDESLFQQLK